MAGYSGAFLAMTGERCGSTTACSAERLSPGVVVAMIGPAVVVVVAVIERLIHARSAALVVIAPPSSRFALRFVFVSMFEYNDT